MPRPFDISSLEEAPKNRRDRVYGKAYIHCDEICIWKGYWCCLHGKQKYHCKECGGAGICQHGKQRYYCKECGGSAICEHGKQKYFCKECGGSSICEHGKRKYRCKECGGAGICQHGKQKETCKECGGSQICLHLRVKYTCKECRGAGICEHGKNKRYCKECGPIKRKTSDLEVIAVVKGNLPIKRPKIKKEKNVPEDVQLKVDEVYNRPSRPSRYKVTKIKNEDKPNGIIKCPRCENGIVSNRGCNMVTCRVHKPNYFYFCFHCKTESPNGIQCSKCPSRIDADSQLDYLRTSMNVTIENGVINI